MKIIHTEASWGWGGQEIRILTECAEFIKNGHEVTLVADFRSTIAKKAPDFGIPVEFVHLRSKRARDLCSTLNAIKKLKPDLVVCHSSTDHWLVALARLTINRKHAIVRARHISTKINRLPTTRWLYRYGCEGCLTTSTSIQRAMIKDGLGSTENTVCIPTGIAPPSGAENYLVARDSLNISMDTFVISIIATLRSWKGHEYLLKAVRAIKTENVVLLIAGDGPQRHALERLVVKLELDHQVRFLGHTTEVYRILSSSDIFVLPSYANEGIPQALLQAMAIGLPIISCPIGGIPEALKGYAQKTLVPPRSPEHLATAISHLHKEFDPSPLKSPPIRSPIMKFSREKMYEECLKFYLASIERLKSRRANCS